MDRSDLAARMKDYYESVPKTKLMRRTPVVIRLDGRSFHTFTRGFQKPFDEVLVATMQETMKYLCENVQGCVLGYTQSDEITLILVDYQELDTAAWFDYEVQKLCSITASMTTMAFNKYFAKNALSYIGEKEFTFLSENEKKEAFTLYGTYDRAINKGAMFDARCFNIPKEEVTNLIYWRQLDASRNSVQMVGQANFSHKELLNKTCNMIQDLLMTQKGINWNDLPTHLKRGSCCIKFINTTNEDHRSGWVIDKEIPIFKGEGRDYIEKLINFE